MHAYVDVALQVLLWSATVGYLKLKTSAAKENVLHHWNVNNSHRIVPCLLSKISHTVVILVYTSTHAHTHMHTHARTHIYIQCTHNYMYI